MLCQFLKPWRKNTKHNYMCLPIPMFRYVLATSGHLTLPPTLNSPPASFPHFTFILYFPLFRLHAIRPHVLTVLLPSTVAAATEVETKSVTRWWLEALPPAAGCCCLRRRRPRQAAGRPGHRRHRSRRRPCLAAGRPLAYLELCLWRPPHLR